MSRIAIIDYGVGNLYSVQKMLECVELEWVLTSDSTTIDSCCGILLPGVGAFKKASEQITSRGLDEILKLQASKGKLILGICLGMQLLFDCSTEDGLSYGLGLIEGMVDLIPSKVKVPHVGWNSLDMTKECKMLKNCKDGDYVYFVHSYYAKPQYKEAVKAVTEYGIKIPAVVSKDNVYGFQFHPEKSGSTGMNIMKNLKEMFI